MRIIILWSMNQLCFLIWNLWSSFVLFTFIIWFLAIFSVAGTWLFGNTSSCKVWLDTNRCSCFGVHFISFVVHLRKFVIWILAFEINVACDFLERSNRNFLNDQNGIFFRNASSIKVLTSTSAPSCSIAPFYSDSHARSTAILPLFVDRIFKQFIFITWSFNASSILFLTALTSVVVLYVLI